MPTAPGKIEVKSEDNNRKIFGNQTYLRRLY